jgi:hypothetical protein
MLSTIATLSIALMTTTPSTVRLGPTQTDTVISVRPNTRLELENFSGAIAVRTWPKSAVRVAATHSARMQVEFESDESSLSIRGRSNRGVATHVDYELTVPEWMALDLSGVATDISVVAIKNTIKAETIKGDIDVRGGTGYLTLGTVEGIVQVRGARGKVAASSVNRGVRLADVTGDVNAESVNGSIILQAVESDHVAASTINGTLFFLGAIRDDGSYAFSTHNGDIWIGVPEKTNATVAVATFGGEFKSSFPVTVKQARKGKRFQFALGTGKAQVELESFMGSIRLARPDQMSAVLVAGKDKAKAKGGEEGEDPDWEFHFGVEEGK